MPASLGHPLLLGLAKQLGTVLGKSLLKKVDPQLYIICFGKSTDELLTEHLANLKEELKDYMRQIQQENKEDEIIKARGWLRDTYSTKLSTLAQGKHVDASIVLGELAHYQRQMQDLAEIIERRLTPEQLASCDYATRLKVELHRLAFLTRLVLMAARIYWYRLANAGQAEDSLEAEFQAYATARLAASEHMMERLRQGRYDKIVGPYHLNAGQFDGERRLYLNESGLFFNATFPLHHFYNWRDDFESSKPADPFGGGKLYEVFQYNISKNFNPIGWLPLVPKENNAQEETNTRVRAEQDRNKHFGDVERLFKLHVENPFEEARQDVKRSLDALDALQRNDLELSN